MNGKRMVVILFGFSFLFQLLGCAIWKPSLKPLHPLQHPQAQREFRAAWIATVVNIDWPSAPGLSVEEQKTEALAILDSAQKLNLNALILQVRPQCDALYLSDLEPWSYYLTGEQGKAPDPFYDPLDFWIEQAHDRGIELHAWFNPYRAHHPNGGEITEASLVIKRPGIIKKIPTGYHWMDPARQETQDHSFNVVMDVVRRYDIDGVHFDDYFYPYDNGNFPDDDSWEAYLAGGGALSRDDWRRDNVNHFIERLYYAIKEEKNYVKFGLSPFGIWRPYYPASIRGFDQYAMLYADARLWLNEGWIDYWSPQLYWPVNQIPQSFPVLLNWWSRENTYNRNLWPGMFTSRMRGAEGVDENINQIMITRGMVSDGPGHIHFSMKALLQDTIGLTAALRQGPYRDPALVPASPWLDDQPPLAPNLEVKVTEDTIAMEWTHPNPDDVFRWVVYINYGGFWHYQIFNRKDRRCILPSYHVINKEEEDGVTIDKIFITQIGLSAVDRTGNESERTYLKIKE